MIILLAKFELFFIISYLSFNCNLEENIYKSQQLDKLKNQEKD